MIEILVVLALIPLALVGLWIVLGVGWLLLPYAVVIGGALVAWLMSESPDARQYVFCPVIITLMGAAWAVNRWKS